MANIHALHNHTIAINGFVTTRIDTRTTIPMSLASRVAPPPPFPPFHVDRNYLYELRVDKSLNPRRILRNLEIYKDELQTSRNGSLRGGGS